MQTASFLTGLSVTGLHYDPKYISTAVKTILEFSEIPHILDADKYIFTDIVGTGGDGQNTFNVSTSSAIVVAGMEHGNLVVTKHGGKASTSTSGAGDLITNLGIDIGKINAGAISKLVASQSKFVFLFAPNFHAGMKSVAAIRKQLGFPTIFNILGPLLNPVKLDSRVLGVYSEELGEIYAQTIKELHPDHANGNKYSTIVVWGEVGLDEVSPLGKTKIWYIDPNTGNVNSEFISPADFGLPEHPLDLVRSGTAKENADYLKKVLANQVQASDPILQYILMNSAVLAVSCGIAKDWKDGVQLARKSIQSGKALGALDGLINNIDSL